MRLTVTLVGIAFAVFLMTFQGSLLMGFLSASSAVIDRADADIWVSARGVPCFDFSASLPERFRDLARGVPGVASVRRVATSFGTWQKPDGVRQTVIVIGADPVEPSDFPAPRSAGAGGAILPEAVLTDASDRAYLGLDGAGESVEINRRRARVWGVVRGFGSFIGSPYVFTGYEDAKRYASIGPEETTFLLCRVDPGRAPAAVKTALAARLPEADVWTQAEFSRRARSYWVTQTGAGGAILLAGLLGFLVGLVVVSQTIYATTMESIDEFATLKAMGASRRYVRGVVLFQALASGLAGYALGFGLSVPAIAGLRGTIAWVSSPWWMPIAMLVVTMGMCGLASLMSVRRALGVDPGRVFRG